MGRDSRLLLRTLAYYGSMGVDDIWLNVHARPEWGNDFLQTVGRIADAHGARIARVHAYPYIESNLTTRRVIEEQADPDDWILYSDVDEFQVYPNGPRHALELCRQHGCDFLWGTLIDRISADGRLHLLNDRSLWNQFPLRAWVTGHVRRGDARKVVLARADVVLGGGQHFAENGRGLPIELCQAVVHHFRWDHDAVRSARYLQGALEQYGAHWNAEYQRLLEYLDRNERRFDVSDAGLGCCVDPYVRDLQSDAPAPAAAVAGATGSPPSDDQAQIELLRGLDIARNPDLYSDPDE
ncbi:MAG: glycosyltransferase family 2 protein, partial [Arenicellales bacterium]